MKRDRHREDRVVENAVDICFEISRWHVNPYAYLYHNPHGIQTLQYFAHWTQRWTNRNAFITLLQAAKVGGYEAVPAELLHRHFTRWKSRRVRCGQLTFYLIRIEEMPAGLQRRYHKFRILLKEHLRKYNNGKPTTFEIAEKKAE